MSAQRKILEHPLFRALGWLEANFERVLVAGVLAVFSIVLILQVFMRFALRAPLSWPEELSRYLLIWAAFIGSSLAVREARIINIDVLPSMSTGWVRQAFHVVMHVGFLIFCLVASYHSLDFITRIARSGQVSPAMGIPMWLVYCAAPIGLSLAAIRTVQALIAPAPETEIHYEERS
ncbi:TRAP transporter small permease [Mariluticola halotolerans]|uniref:TRAP transporter small permease n=1 Tax=Mariluticola halotolerans TaxID=2909283 RepID=UPI0026E1D01C|nr:TRAP transporter small permease [Mariluticola halotolerans]UJQ96096.1 TRAP transporter small permease [Mariluticola halotolerans]